MSDELKDFENLVQRVKEGSNEAVQELIDKYGQSLVRAIRRRLDERLRRRFDTQDFTQEAFKSFYAHRSRLPEFGTPGELIAFLSRIATHKIAREYRLLDAQARHQAAEQVSLEELKLEWSRHLRPPHQPTPSEIVMAKEAQEERVRLVAGSPEQQRRIWELRESGATYDQIAEVMGMSEVKVRRILRRMTKDGAE